MEFSEVLERRRSVRKFLPEAVPEAVIRKAIAEALLAPNSSNMQPWEFYWVRSPEKKKALVEACFSQPGAATAAELVVAVARVDTWPRNRQLMLEALSRLERVPRSATTYYQKIVPMMYRKGPLGVFGLIMGVAMFFVGFFKPVPRGWGRKDREQVVVKTTALACENFMLSITNQGYASCPMEGLDEARVKRILKLPCGSRVVMGLAVGKGDPTGVYGPRIRFDPKLFIFEV